MTAESIAPVTNRSPAAVGLRRRLGVPVGGRFDRFRPMPCTWPRCGAAASGPAACHRRTQACTTSVLTHPQYTPPGYNQDDGWRSRPAGPTGPERAAHWPLPYTREGHLR
jgi:hypothetical protein